MTAKRRREGRVYGLDGGPLRHVYAQAIAYYEAFDRWGFVRDVVAEESGRPAGLTAWCWYGKHGDCRGRRLGGIQRCQCQCHEGRRR